MPFQLAMRGLISVMMLVGCATPATETRMNRLSWEETEAIREALFHSRMDHQSKSPPHTAAMQRVEAAEKELAGLLGVSVPFSYSPEGTGE